MKKTLNKIADLKKRILSLPKRAQEACLWHMENLANFQQTGLEYNKKVNILFEVIQNSYLKKAELTKKDAQASNIRCQIKEEVRAFAGLNCAHQKKMIRFFRGDRKKYKSVFAKDITILIDNSRS